MNISRSHIYITSYKKKTEKNPDLYVLDMQSKPHLQKYLELYKES